MNSNCNILFSSVRVFHFLFIGLVFQIPKRKKWIKIHTILMIANRQFFWSCTSTVSQPHHFFCWETEKIQASTWLSWNNDTLLIIYFAKSQSRFGFAPSRSKVNIKKQPSVRTVSQQVNSHKANIDATYKNRISIVSLAGSYFVQMLFPHLLLGRNQCSGGHVKSDRYVRYLCGISVIVHKKCTVVETTAIIMQHEGFWR